MSEKIKRHVVGVDVNTGFTTYAVVDVLGGIVAKEKFSTFDYTDVNDYAKVLSEKIVELAERTCGYENIRSVGVSAPSGNFVTGTIENAANIPWKGRIPLAAMLRDRLGIAVALGNDAHVTAMGEKSFGAARGLRNFIVITVSHGGVGSSVFLNGRAYLGTDGFSGEFGHTCIRENGRLCSCGRRGCLEEYLAGRGLVRMALSIAEETGKPTVLHKDTITTQLIAEACEQGDEVALETFRRIGKSWGETLSTYASLIDPEAIILTGGLAVYHQWILESMKESFEANIYHNLRGKVKLLVSPLEDSDRDVLGASALAWEVEEYSLFK